MFKYVLGLCFVLLSSALFAQEEESHSIAIPAVHQQNQKDLFSSSLSFRQSPALGFGMFKVRRFILPTIEELQAIDSNRSINILAIGRAKARYKQSYIGKTKSIARQMAQIEAGTQIMIERTNPWERGNLSYYDRDNVENESLELFHQPLTFPTYHTYYNAYRWGYGRYNVPGRFYFY